MRVFDVFTPTGVPTSTYVDRGHLDLEAQLRNAIRTPGMIASLSGPSKSGKTVLMRKVIDQDLLISISGAALKDPNFLWDRVLNWMEAPSQTVSGSTHAVEVEADVKGSVRVPFVAKGEAGAKGSYAYDRSSERTYIRAGIDQVVKEIGGSDFVVFIDDFHYMPKEIQTDVARQLKEAAERGVNICTASVPHRADDVVRGNAELRGRVQNIDFKYWSVEETRKIAEQGFSTLGVEIPSSALTSMAEEAFGSPQLMQQICLQTCLRIGIDEVESPTRKIPLSSSELKRAFEQASTTTDFSSLLEALHNGPKQRGTNRNQFAFSDGSKGDVYRCILLGLRENPPRLSFAYDDIYNRAKSVCVGGDAPPGSSVASSLEQLHTIAAEIEPNVAILEWSDDVLDIVDPYFLYYLRCSPRLAALEK